MQLATGQAMKMFAQVNSHIDFLKIDPPQMLTKPALEELPELASVVANIDFMTCKKMPLVSAIKNELLGRLSLFNRELVDPEELAKILSRKYDFIWVGTAKLSHLIYDFEQVLGSRRDETNIVLGTNDSIYHSYFERGVFALSGKNERTIGNLVGLFRSPFIALSERRYLQRFDFVHVQTLRERKRLERLVATSHHHKFMVAQSGFPEGLLGLDYQSNLEDSVLLMCQLDSGREAHALWFLKHVWSAVVESRPMARLIIHGASPTTEVFNKISSYKGVAICGYAKTLQRAYANKTICVVPIHQSSGIITRIIDAMAAGVPVVTTVSAASTVAGFENGVNGFATSKPNEMAEYILRLLESPELRQQMSDGGRACIESMTWEKAFCKMRRSLGLVR